MKTSNKTMVSTNRQQSNENKNGMSQVIIDLRPQVKQQDGHGREVLADVHFRIDVRAYSANLYTYTQEAREESNKAVTAYDREIVELLTAEGWTLKTENYGPGECPELVKGTQYLYCHPQDISGQVNPADIETLEAKIKAMTTCKYFTTDNYGDIIVTTSESDEKQLYRDTYADGLAAIWQEVTTTKRSNLYKDKGEAEHCVRRRICIANRRADLNDIGTGSYNMRTPLLQFLMEEYDRLLKDGYIKEAEGANGRTLCRWINKREEKERAKAIREAEKAAKKAQQEQEREAATLEQAGEITDTQAAQDFADALEIREGDRVLSKHFQTMGTVTGIYEWNGGTCYDVTLDKAVRGLSGETITKTAFRRYGITKNYYPQGTSEIACNALYYAEELQAGFWGTDSTPHRFQFGNSEVEVFAPTDRRPSWLLVADIFSQPQEMTLQQVAEYLARRYQEANRLPEPPAEVTISIDGEDHEPTLYERHNITAGEREAKAKGSALYIRHQARMAREAFYIHKGARIETSIAYRNGTDDPDGMSYKVCWYDETRTGELHLVECENGISLEQAARHMADFSLLSECGLTLREILYPAA